MFLALMANAGKCVVDEERICLRGIGWTINSKKILSQLLFRVFPMVSDMQYQSSDLASKFRALPSVVFRRDGIYLGWTKSGEAVGVS